MAGQLADRFLVTGEGVERGGQPGQQRVALARGGEGDLDCSDRLGEAPAEHRALIAAERADAVAGAKEREVRGGDRVKQPLQIGFDPPLHRRLAVFGVGDVERPAAEQYPRPVPQVDIAERALLQPDPVQLTLRQPGQGLERGVLVVGRGILGPDGQQQERFHLITLVTPCPCRDQRRGQDS
jgi:hypothetical protein